jgi:NADH:ubiquinone oxidoreductase subunit E
VQDVRQDLSPLLADLPREQRYLLPALQRVNAQLGYLPLWALEAVGEHLRVPRSEVHGVASHYPELRLEPGGRHLVRVCTGLSCQVVGGAAVQQALERALGLRAGQQREDGSLSFEPMACAFLCSVAPLVEVDHAAYGGLDPERAAALVRPLIERPA